MELRRKNIPLLQVILGASLVFVLFWLYWPVLSSLLTFLYNNEDYSYGLLLPFVSGYIVYLKWPQNRVQAWRPSWWGLVIMAFGLALYVGGELAADLFFPRISLVIVLMGVLLLLSGWIIVRQLAFPLLLLFFMIPLPSILTQQLTLPLQLISSRLAALFLRVLGIPVVLQGNVIDLGVRQLQVVEACSGLRYVLPLLALGIIYCYFFQRRLWKVAVLIIGIIPSAIIANAIRIATMGVFPALQQPGFLHSFSGWLIFIFCFGVLALLNWGLNTFQPENPEPISVDIREEASHPINNSPSNYTKYLIAGLILVMAVSPLVMRMAQVSSVPLLQSFDNFPMALGPWHGRLEYMDPKMVKGTQCDDYLNAKFTNKKHESIDLWIAYYENQKKGTGFVHSPLICLTGGGWNVIKSEVYQIAPGLPVRYLLMNQAGSRIVVYYWYLQRGRWLCNEYINKFYMGFDRLLTRRADGSLIRLTTVATPDVESARTRLDSFARQIIPLLPQFIRD